MTNLQLVCTVARLILASTEERVKEHITELNGAVWVGACREACRLLTTPADDEVEHRRVLVALVHGQRGVFRDHGRLRLLSDGDFGPFSGTST